MRCSASSMPSPSRSNFTSPMAAQSSLSHCSTLRPGMRPHSTGQTSITGRSHSTMPAEWMPRWRGRSSTSAASSATSGGIPSPRHRSTRPRPHRLGRRRSPVAPVDPRRPPVHLLGREPEGLAHVAHGRAGAVGDDVGHLGGVAAAVPLVDVLDDLLAPARLDVDVDVRRSVAGRGQEALEEQPEGDGVDVGDPEGVTDGRVGGRAPALAVDVEAAADLGDVPDDEEVAGEPEAADDLELVVDLGPGPRHPLVVGRAVALECAPGSPAGAGSPARPVPAGTGKSGSRGATSRRSKAQARPSSAARSTTPGQRAKRRSCSPAPRRQAVGADGEPALQLGQRPPGPDGGQGGGQAEPGRRGVVHVVGGHRRPPPTRRPAAASASLRAVSSGSPWSHSSTATLAPPERLHQPADLAGGRPGPRLHQRGGHRPLAASGEHQPVVPRRRGQVVEGEDGAPLLAALQVGLGQDGRQPARSPRGPGPARPGGSRSGRAHRCAARPGARVTSVPKTVGRPVARAASAKRTTP